MKYSKYRCSAVVLNGDIYVMGKIMYCFLFNLSWYAIFLMILLEGVD